MPVRFSVADTYNNRIKKVYPVTKEACAFVGTGLPGDADGVADEAQFHEPAGLSIANGKMYVADTNNHAIRTVELATGRVGTLRIQGLGPPAENATRAGGH